MRIGRLLLRIISVVTMCTTVSCEKFDDYTTAMPIGFDADVIETKGANYLTSSSITSMRVYGAQTRLLFSESAQVGDLIDGAEVKKIGTNWVPDQKYYYPPSGYASFFAFAPYINDQSIFDGSSYLAGYYSVKYTPSSNVSQQVDFCVAKPVLDIETKDDTICFEFEHATANILFSASYIGTMPPGQYLYVESLSISGLIGTKRLVTKTESPYFQWDSGGVRNTTYNLTRSNNQITGNSLNSMNSMILNGPETSGLLFLIPQAIPEATATVTITFGWYNGNTKVKEKTLSVPIPSGQWQAGTKIQYNIVIDVNQLHLAIEDWSNIIINGSISD